MEVTSIRIDPEMLDVSLNIGILPLASSFVTWIIIVGSLSSATYFGQKYTNIFKSNNSILFYIISCFGSMLISVFVNFVPDDIFAHFRVVDNLITKNQYVFNKDEYIEGTATPIWHALLFGISKLNLDYIQAARLLGIGVMPWLVLVQMLISQLLMADLDEKYSKVIFWSPLVFALNPIYLIYAGSGMETLIYNFVASLFIFSFLKQKLYFSLLLSALVIGLRFDGFVLVVAFLLAAYIFNLSGRKNFKNILMVLLFSIIIFSAIAIFRFIYFNEVIPHVVKMKTLSDEKLIAGLSYLISFLFLFSVSGIFLLIATYKQFKLRLAGYREQFFLVFVSIILISTVTVGGGDWMPTSRYLIVPSMLLLCVMVAAMGNVERSKSSKVSVSIIAPILCIAPIISLFLPPPTPFRNGYLSLQAPSTFIRLLKEDAQKIMTLGRVISILDHEKVIDVESLYTRWIGFIPYAVGSDIRIIDELAYFHRWTPEELAGSNRTNKVGHLIETLSRIQSEGPSVITNISSARSTPYLSESKLHPSKTLNEQITRNANISQDLKSFLAENYKILQILDMNAGTQFEILVNKNSILN